LIRFSYALLLFVAILTVVYFAILWFNGKFGVRHKHHLKVTTVKMTMVGTYVSIILLTISQRLWNTSVFYFLLYPTTVFLFLITVVESDNSNKKYLLVSAMLLHLIVLSIVFPPSGIFIDERTPALVKLDQAKNWDPNSQMLNSYYNPFPMDLGLFYVFSEVTGFSYIDLLSGWIVAFLFVIAYDLTLFSLAKKISGSWKVGILSILLFTFTPPATINPQPQWLANFFILVFLFGLFKALKDVPSLSSIVLVNLSYATAILLHGTAAIGVAVVTVLLALMCFGRRFGVNIATTARHRSFLYVVSISVYIMTFGRWIILRGLEPVLNPLIGLVTDILGYGEISWIGAQYVPLYDQFVSPISAYAWSVPIALALAFVLYHLITRVQKKSLSTVFASSLGITAALLAFGGFLGSLFMAYGNLQRYLGYAGLVLFIPAAAIAFVRIVRLSTWKVLSIGLISIVLFSGIGICDPEFSPQLYSGITTVNPARSADLIEGKTLYIIIPNGMSVFATYEILTAFSYLTIESNSTGKVIYFGGSLKTHRIMVERLMEEGKAASGVTYVWTSEILKVAANVSVNVVYDSGRHVAVRGAG